MNDLLKESLDLLANNKVGQKRSQDLEDELDAFLNWDAQSPKRQYELICKEIDANWNYPTAPIMNLLRQKCRLEHELKMNLVSALTMLQSQGLAFRHQALNQYCKKVMQDESNDLAAMQQEILEFQTSARSGQQLKDIIKDLPQDWRVVQISVDDIFSDSRFKKTLQENAISKNLALKLVAVECGDTKALDFVTIHDILALPDEDKMPSLQAELDNILATHRLMYKADKSDKAKHKTIRTEVDERLESLVSVMEQKLLGFRKVLLLGKTDADNDIAQICDKLQKKYFSSDRDFVVSGHRKLLHMIISGHRHLTDEQIYKGLEFLNKKPTFHKDVKAAFHQIPYDLKHKPVVLILDKDVQSLPWESMTCLQGQPMSRVPSIHTLALLYKTHLKNETSVPKSGEIKQSKIFYVLNPDKNLAKTQERLEPSFAEMSIGSGLVGEQPSLPQMKKVLSEMDAYMYCGHGANLKNFTTQDIEKLNIRALPLLFGCNSGRLQRLGRLLDPTGVVHHYLIAQAPCLLGFLWSITDTDVDQWTVDFLRHWLNQDQQPEFVQAVSDKRKGFNRKINEAAVVIYGLPSIKCQ